MNAIKCLTYLGYLYFTVLSNLFTSVVIKLLIAQILVFSGSFGLCVDIYIIMKGPLPVNLVNVFFLISWFI